MAITLPEGFIVTGVEPIDSRLVLTKEQMRGYKPVQMPSVYLCVCSEDRKIYIFDGAIPKAEADPETGRFRPLENYLNFTATEEAKANIEEAVASSISESADIQAVIGEIVEKEISVNGGLIIDDDDNEDANADGGLITE